MVGTVKSEGEFRVTSGLAVRWMAEQSSLISSRSALRGYLIRLYWLQPFVKVEAALRAGQPLTDGRPLDTALSSDLPMQDCVVSLPTL